MFSTGWETSKREYSVAIEKGVRIPVDDGITLYSDVFRPDAPGKFPVILCAHPYNQEAQSTPMVPEGIHVRRAFIESGDYNFYARRGYVFVIMNIRGSGKSDGKFSNRNPDERTVRDVYEAIEWLAKQPWCDGNVGMFGVSYFAVIQKRVAAMNPPSLKAIFALYGWTEGYRDLFYHGGIFAWGFFSAWARNRGPGMRIAADLRAELGDNAYTSMIEELRADREIMSTPFLAEVMREPEKVPFPLIVEVLMHKCDDEWHKSRAVDFAASRIPAYFGADWGMFGFHMPGDVRAFEQWQAPKRFVMGPPIYLDRPVYQYAYESLRWFDYWLKGKEENRMMDEPAVKLFIVGSNEWKFADTWPLPETRWTPFYLHADGWLSEHEMFPDGGSTAYTDSQYERGEAWFTTPKMVEKTEICGPIALNLWASTSDTEVLFFASLWLVDTDGTKSMLTRGWLRGSQRKLDPERSKPWQPVQSHLEREPLTPDEITEFNIEIRPYGIELQPGQRLALKIKSADDETPTNFNENVSRGHVLRPQYSRVTIHHNPDCPSHLLLPVTKGNVIGTFFSGGDLPPLGPGGGGGG
jgi:predicted acyl esterase